MHWKDWAGWSVFLSHGDAWTRRRRAVACAYVASSSRFAIRARLHGFACDPIRTNKLRVHAFELSVCQPPLSLFDGSHEASTRHTNKLLALTSCCVQRLPVDGASIAFAASLLTADFYANRHLRLPRPLDLRQEVAVSSIAGYSKSSPAPWGPLPDSICLVLSCRGRR